MSGFVTLLPDGGIAVGVSLEELPDADRQLIERAALANGVSVGEFMSKAALEIADDILSGKKAR